MNDDQAKEEKQQENTSSEPSLEEQLKTYKDGWQRALADYENLKRDLLKEKLAARQSVKEDLAESLLPVIDNFDFAVRHAPEIEDCPDDLKKKLESWMSGVGYIEKQFTDVLGSLDIDPIPTDGLFDPHLHEATSERSEEDRPEGAVLEVLQRGWKIGDKVLRPAKVVVNSLKEKE